MNCEQCETAGLPPPHGAAWSEARSNAEIPPCLAVVMPVYNERASAVQVVRRVLEQRPVQELIVVDDGSQDGTWEALQAMRCPDSRLKLLRHPVNQGKGAALRTGFRLTTAPLVIVQDADFEYDPAEYHSLLTPILADRADVVFGSRFIGSNAHRVLLFWHSLGNRFLTTLSNMGTNLNLTDMECCYKAFRRGCCSGLRWRRTGSVSSRRLSRK